MLTDQPHILPLTRDNLAHNFPAAAAAAQRGSHAHTEAAAAQQGSQAHATVVPTASSAAAAFAAAFGSEPQPAAAGAAGMQGAQAGAGAADAGWQVFGAGPLVAEFTWGESAQELHARVAEAAAQRAGSAAAAAAVGAVPPEQQQQPPLQAQQAAALFDVIVGADLLYDPGCHAALLGSLEELVAPHTQVCRAAAAATFACPRCCLHWLFAAAAAAGSKACMLLLRAGVSLLPAPRPGGGGL